MQPTVCTRKHCSAFQRRKQSSACPFQEGTRPEPTPLNPQKHAQRQMPRPNAVIALGAQADTPQAPEISYKISYEISYHDVDKPCLCLCSPSQVVFPDLGLGSASTMSMTLQLRAASSRPQYCTTAPPSTTAVHWKCCTAFAVASKHTQLACWSSSYSNAAHCQGSEHPRHNRSSLCRHIS